MASRVTVALSKRLLSQEQGKPDYKSNWLVSFISVLSKTEYHKILFSSQLD